MPGARCQVLDTWCCADGSSRENTRRTRVRVVTVWLTFDNARNSHQSVDVNAVAPTGIPRASSRVDALGLGEIPADLFRSGVEAAGPLAYLPAPTRSGHRAPMSVNVSAHPCSLQIIDRRSSRRDTQGSPRSHPGSPARQRASSHLFGPCLEWRI